MNSKKFVVSIAFILFSLVVSIYAALWLLPESRYMQSEYSAWMQQRDYSSCRHANQEILLLGDSRMKIDIAALDVAENVYNLSLAGSSPIDMYFTLKRYLQAGNIPREVYVGFAPTHLAFFENYTDRGLFFHYYTDDEIKEINSDILKYENVDYSGEVKKYKWRSPAVYLTALLHSLKEDRAKENVDTYTILEKNNGTLTLQGIKDEKSPVVPEECRQKGFKVKKVLDYYLCQIINMCNERNIPVHVVQLPIGKKGVEILKETGYMDEYESYMRSVAERTGADVETQIPVYEDALFADNSHLNENGQTVYTAYFRSKYIHDNRN